MSSQISDETGSKQSQEGRMQALLREKPPEPENMVVRILGGLLCLVVMITGGGALVMLMQGESVSMLFIILGATTIAALVALSYLLNLRK